MPAISEPPADERSDTPLNDALVQRIKQVRLFDRARKLRVQLPLMIAGIVIVALNFGVGLAIEWSVISAFGVSLGGWTVLLGVRPTNTRAVATAIAVYTLVTTYALTLNLAQLALLETGPQCTSALASTRACALFVAMTCFAIGVLACSIVHAIYLALGLLGGVVRARRGLPRLPKRAAFDALWRGLGLTMLGMAVFWLVVGIDELYIVHANLPRPLFMFSANAFEQRLPPIVSAVVHVLLGVQLSALGALALWSRPRNALLAKLASRGDGVATAAGISALLGARTSDELIALAQSTFRAVRLDRLRIEHLSSASPSADAFAQSMVAPLGSVDAFLSHSWSDSVEDKWAALQEWRVEFKRAYRREPQVWLDRCCIDPTALTDQLPCLPIWLAGCDAVLALRGPSYLHRLWCVVEIFVFHSMKSEASRIRIIDLKNTPKYTSRGLARSRPTRRNSGSAVVSAMSASFEADNAASRTSRIQPTHAELHRSTTGNFVRTFQGPPPRRSSVGSHASRRSAAVATLYRPFDVRLAECTVQSDADVLQSMIETSGTGVDSFNSWMHELLSRQAAADDLES